MRRGAVQWVDFDPERLADMVGSQRTLRCLRLAHNSAGR